MPKPNRTRAQELLKAIATKNKELQDEINQTEAKKTCPFWHEFSVKADDCIYMQHSQKCEDLELCPGNSDAWCYKQIEVGIKKEKESEIMSALKVVLDRYADLRCNTCEMCEH